MVCDEHVGGGTGARSDVNESFHDNGANCHFDLY